MLACWQPHNTPTPSASSASDSTLHSRSPQSAPQVCSVLHRPTPDMVAFITIPRTIFAPADPEEPSFRTTLPAELRNRIYEMLFKRDGLVLLHNTAAYYPKLPVLQPNSSTNSLIMGEFDSQFENNIAGRREFLYDSQVALLLSCRQFYHESIGTLYGQNKFIFSRALHRYDHAAGDRSLEYKNSEYQPLVYAPQWLSSIGSHISLLSEIFIDSDAFCP